MVHFPIPDGADEKSKKAIKALEAKLGHMVISKAEIQFIVEGIMKAQVPRDKERLVQDANRKVALEERKQAILRMQRARYQPRP